MSDAHKAALAVGREEGRAVRRYLDALEAGRSKPGRKRTQDVVRRQLEETTVLLARGTGLERLHLSQRRIDLESELASFGRNGAADIGALEAAFVRALPGYSRRKHISYGAWREVGVPARVLREAGIRRTGP